MSTMYVYGAEHVVNHDFKNNLQSRFYHDGSHDKVSKKDCAIVCDARTGDIFYAHTLSSQRLDPKENHLLGIVDPDKLVHISGREPRLVGFYIEGGTHDSHNKEAFDGLSSEEQTCVLHAATRLPPHERPSELFGHLWVDGHVDRSAGLFSQEVPGGYTSITRPHHLKPATTPLASPKG